MNLKNIVLSIFCAVLLLTCDKEIEEDVMQSDLKKDVQMVTDFGTIILRLSDETPLHRNNFIKLVNQKFYDSISFHRVIENFMIQSGDPETKNTNSNKAPGKTNLPYTIPAEFNLNLFHKKGALAAAREGDDTNPSRASSSTQFYIVHGKTFNDSTLDVSLNRINKWWDYNTIINKKEHKAKQVQLRTIRSNWSNSDSLTKATANTIKKEFDSLADIELEKIKKYTYPQNHSEVYKTLGGAAHLDQNYTVFGEVIQGIEVVDSIAAVERDNRNKPLQDVRIITVSMINRKNY
jgi:cyclophilin family peptidyl-prolyl cis-trans isomerase